MEGRELVVGRTVGWHDGCPDGSVDGCFVGWVEGNCDWGRTGDGSDGSKVG